ncbi:hypothetical protein EKO04_004593 [Ascochyta lentis]|uniref:Splicing factor YJU2 n=1 Tax=Ascochyta lentis TaxID=205686 RepID=A0A8H7J517_9PLEO|nr:hypothetical protein EKO04_004593 [Ascochyta lentis]
MADRKCISKYIPADFDPSKLGSRSTKRSQTVVNFVCPFRSIRCLSCGSFTTKGTKFYNALEEVSPDTYLGCKIIRLHLKCLRCRAPIIIETDPKMGDYRLVRNEAEVEENTETRVNRLEREAFGIDEPGFERFEGKLEDAKKEMDVEDALEEIRAADARREDVQTSSSLLAIDGQRKIMDIVDAKLAQAAFRRSKKKILALDEEDDGANLWNILPRKRKKGLNVLQGLKRKTAQ